MSAAADAVKRVVLLPGDGIGPEIMAVAEQVLALLPIRASYEKHLLGAEAIRATGDPLPDETLKACLSADAVLKGPVGDPAYVSTPVRPEQGLFRLRAALETYANVRPVVGTKVDLVIVRELLGGLYTGKEEHRQDGTVVDLCEYHPAQVDRIARFAFELAETRGKRITSVDKANVLATSRMWRAVVSEVAAEYEQVAVEHMLVDNTAMQLVLDPSQFDVILTENMFGDILSDEAAALIGGISLAGSASVGKKGNGLFEPVHGSAPTIAGQGIANPTAMLRSVALMLRIGLAQPALAELIEASVTVALADVPTADIGGKASTNEFGDRVRKTLERALAADSAGGW